jgi:multidrug efflux pump subunit AcrA (membrane-fusion protein)
MGKEKLADDPVRAAKKAAKKSSKRKAQEQKRDADLSVKTPTALEKEISRVKAQHGESASTRLQQLRDAKREAERKKQQQQNATAAVRPSHYHLCLYYAFMAPFGSIALHKATHNSCSALLPMHLRVTLFRKSTAWIRFDPMALPQVQYNRTRFLLHHLQDQPKLWLLQARRLLLSGALNRLNVSTRTILSSHHRRDLRRTEQAARRPLSVRPMRMLLEEVAVDGNWRRFRIGAKLLLSSQSRLLRIKMR